MAKELPFKANRTDSSLKFSKLSNNINYGTDVYIYSNNNHDLFNWKKKFLNENYLAFNRL